ncbi:MAG: NERD domain-containing protein [Erysipelotrichia bacterium]|nr:NERD domain-containing protein [Erysipelotrichia bacterium]
MRIFNGIKNFFKKISLGISRTTGYSLPFTSSKKRVGNYGELEVYNELRTKLPEAIIIRNVCLNSKLAKGEIDFLIIYQAKVFVLELKSWRGNIYQDGDQFFQNKQSSGGNSYVNKLDNPFKQIKRNLYQIKQQFNNLWFEPIILFIETNSININRDIEWFTSVDKLVNYINSVDIKTNNEYHINSMMEKIQSYDKIISSSRFNKELSCIIDDSSLRFIANEKEIIKDDIISIKVNHHFSYDDVIITLGNREEVLFRLNNHKITFRKNGKSDIVNLSKIDVIFVNHK